MVVQVYHADTPNPYEGLAGLQYIPRVPIAPGLCIVKNCYYHQMKQFIEYLMKTNTLRGLNTKSEWMACCIHRCCADVYMHNMCTGYLLIPWFVFVMYVSSDVAVAACYDSGGATLV